MTTYDATDFENWEAANERNSRVALGPSDIARCLRQSAYAHHHIPPTEPTTTPTGKSNHTARFGSLLHLGWRSMVIAQRGIESSEVVIDIPELGRPGTADDVDWENRVVNDLKTKSDRSWNTWVTHGVPEDTWEQVELYAYGLICAEQAATPQLILKDRPWTLAVTVINRETGAEARFERPANPDEGRRLARYLAARQQVLNDSTHPEQIPREGDGPDTGFPCDWCPWLSACWPKPEDERLSPQSAMIANDPQMIATALADYAEAQAVESKAAKMKKAAKAYLTGLPEGTYGDHTLGWTGGRPADDVPDGEAAIAKLAAMGLDIPMKTNRTTRKAIQVRRLPPQPVDEPEKVDYVSEPSVPADHR